MTRQALHERAVKLYEELKMLYASPYPDRHDGEADVRYRSQLDCYLRKVNASAECIAVLEKFNCEKAAAIFMLVEAFEKDYQEKLICGKFSMLILGMRGYYRPRLAELVRNRFWQLPLGEITVRPYNPNQE